MDKKQVKQILINLNKNFPTKTLQKTNKKQANKNTATNNNTEDATKKSTPQKPTTPKFLDQKTHWLNNNNHPTPLTTNLLLKQMEVLSVV